LIKSTKSTRSIKATMRVENGLEFETSSGQSAIGTIGWCSVRCNWAQVATTLTLAWSRVWVSLIASRSNVVKIPRGRWSDSCSCAIGRVPRAEKGPDLLGSNKASRQHSSEPCLGALNQQLSGLSLFHDFPASKTPKTVNISATSQRSYLCPVPP